MNDIKAAITDIQKNYNSAEYPVEFLAKYDQMELLADSHGTETFLIQQKNNRRFYIAKCYDKKLYTTVQESSILKSLNHKGIPAFADEFQNDNIFCIIREYVPGKPLDQFVAENNLKKKDIIDICVQLCDILTYLHEQEQPVIHRDIKPQNIIVKPDGFISLIDFDISRICHDDTKIDTQFMGTRDYAPPEQYGFSQTDCRTDIYSIGVVLGWLLTGETDNKAASHKVGCDKLASIYKKCTAFSPEDRFKSTRKLKAALIHCDGKRKIAVIRWSAVMLFSLLFLCAGFVIGRYTDFLSMIPGSSAVVAFEEPMIEQAVRLQLGKTSEETITEDDLSSVTGLYIFGDSLISENEEDLHSEALRLFKSNRMKEGPIHSLADLSKMPNLKEIIISMQKITDISVLSDLKYLEVVDLKNNPITDISPLGELKFLKRVTLFDTRITDLSPLFNCPMLSVLDAGKLPIRSLEAFYGLKNLQYLNLYETTIDTLTGIDKLTQIRSFEVSGVIDDDLTPLLSMPHLENVVLGEEMRQVGQTIGGIAKFTISYR